MAGNVPLNPLLRDYDVVMLLLLLLLLLLEEFDDDLLLSDEELEFDDDNSSTLLIVQIFFKLSYCFFYCSNKSLNLSKIFVGLVDFDYLLLSYSL